MNKGILLTFSALAIIASDLAVAVDNTSSAYQTGNIAGKVFIAILAFLIIKKLFFSK